MNRHSNENVDPIYSRDRAGNALRHFSEAEWIDWIGMDITGKKREDMHIHLTLCAECRELYEVWLPLLADPSPEPVSLTEGGYAAVDQATAPHLFPADAVRRKLRRKVQRTGWRRRLATAAVKPAFYRSAAALGACALAGLLVLGLFGTEQGSTTERSRYVSNYEPQALGVLNRPETVSYPLDRSRDDQFTGNVWYNGHSNELFVLIEDLMLQEGHSIQAWAVNGSRRDTLGLVQIEAAKGHLYVKGTQLGEADNIALTVEPPGGSERPTSPDAVWVHLIKR
ncbi:anti-sigma factor [Paenibacillus pedocola]|uniref:anti-sigma factor n=1 Tax=Paenibacillus pedocola TaxID=3242193 RepID=UPI002877CF68|nr:anti-sigma factor [Paenibacillus typhae]